MKQNIEIDLPEGFSVKTINNSLVGKDAGLISIHIEKKQQKTFDWYVDQYLDTAAGSTNDELRNLLDFDDVFVLSGRLKTKQYNLVPWEVKIGLFKFICDDINWYWETVCLYDTKKQIDAIKEIQDIVPLELLKEILVRETK